MKAVLSESERNCILSVDVEDWFHILDLPSTPDLTCWDALPSRVETNFLRLLDILSEGDVSVTCFFLGWIAKKFPRLVTEACHRGHEIASHGYAHRLVWSMTPVEFLQDLQLSKAILEEIAGRPALGYRTAGFSVSRQTSWFFDTVVQAGYAYDSSVFPSPRGHGGLEIDKLGPHVVHTRSGNLLEFPITVKELIGKRFCFFGGGYLRLTPYSLIRGMARQVLREGRPVLFYVHPREIDPSQPRLTMRLSRRFKTYVNLKTTEGKIRRLASDFRFTTYRDFISKRGDQLAN
jgi:polysaccharide deacetylase family protein (PEP-CTERM system associated)